MKGFKKLSLNKETLKLLSPEQTDAVAGGSVSESYTCFSCDPSGCTAACSEVSLCLCSFSYVNTVCQDSH